MLLLAPRLSNDGIASPNGSTAIRRSPTFSPTVDSPMLFQGELGAGNHLLAWNRATGSGGRATPGVYVLRMAIDGVACANRFIVAE